MTIKEAQEIAGTIGYPSKMPGTAYGLPALTHCKVGAILAKKPGSVCHGCYATRGNYRFKGVRNAQQRRLESITNPRWVDAMVTLIENGYRKTSVPFHRWHDSGDLQSVEHLAKIADVARRTPHIRHWLPTRELRIMREYRDSVPANLTVRVSAAYVDGALPREGLVSGVSSKATGETYPSAHYCPAPEQGNSCGDCRVCWSKDVQAVVYRKH